MSLAGCLRIHREYMERHVYQRIFVSVNYHYTNPNKCIGIVQSWHYDHHLIKILLVLTMILLQYYSCRANRQSLNHLPGLDDSKGKQFWGNNVQQTLIYLAWHTHVSKVSTLYTKYLVLKKLIKVKQDFVFEILFKNNWTRHST